VRKRRKPIVLMVDEAHDLHHHTLVGLKRLIEMVAGDDGKLCVLLAGHPKLRRDLRNPAMEEIGYRTAVSLWRASLGANANTSSGCSAPARPTR
jgi:type II secretory pathway predicted ATPase ExeA